MSAGVFGRAVPVVRQAQSAPSPYPVRVNPAAMQKAFATIKAEYAATLPSRFRRTRNYLGGGADSHYANPQHFWQMREYVRDMDRNDGVFGQLVDRAITNEGVLRPIPQTGDEGLNKEIVDRWEAWAENPIECDLARKHAFPEIARLVRRHETIDGDIFALPLDTGQLQVVEGDNVCSPMNLGGDVIHGVRLDEYGGPIEYWFARTRNAQRFAHTVSKSYWSPSDYDRKPALDENGEPVVIHVFDPSRISQSRGITAFHAIFDTSGMLEDLNFAKLIQAQVVSSIAAFIQRDRDYQTGARTNETQADGTVQVLEEVSPGLMYRLRPGETIQGFSPAVPNPEHLPYVRFMLRMIGAAIGMPLSLVLLDTAETTFHGYRGEIQQAEIGFEWRRESIARRFYRPTYRRKIREWYPNRLSDPRIFKHKWRGKGFPYVDPFTDAQADKIRRDNLFVSPRDLAVEHGNDWESIVEETVEDNERMIKRAQEAAARLSTGTDKVTWREVLSLSTPAGVQASLTPPATTPAGSPPKAQGEKP